MAEREGFGPPIPFQVWPLSRRLVSSTHAPLRLLWCRACSAPMIALVAKAFSSRSGTSDEKPKLLQALHLAGLLIVSSGLKKRLQNFATLICLNPCGHLHPMIEPRMVDHLQRRTGGAGLRIAGSIHQPGHARVNHCPCAHGARLNCSKHHAAAQTMVAEARSGLAQRDYLGVGAGIVVHHGTIMASADDLPVFDDHSTNWNFTGCGCQLG